MPGIGGLPGLSALLFAAGPAEVYGVFVGTGVGALFAAGAGVVAGADGAGAGEAGAFDAEVAGAGVATGAGAGDDWPTVGLEASGLLSFVLPGVLRS